MELKTGDRIYCLLYKNTPNELHIIERVTKTIAYSATRKFRREYGHSIDEIGAGGVFKKTYKIETPELNDMYIRVSGEKRIKECNFHNLPTEKIQAILYIIG